jgi:hypothetical protein
MDYTTGKPNHIEDVLIELHTGQWFGWSDPYNKVYDNIILHPTVNGVEVNYEKPTKKSLEDDLQRMQDEFDAQDYARDRAKAYPSFADQFDQIFHEGIDAWKETIQAVKDAHPKPE